MEKEKVLPVGTVVMLKGGKKKVMITGFYIVEKNKKDKIWDYSGCFFPEGIISAKKIFLFDHSQIEKIYHKGLIDDEEIEFKKRLEKVLKENKKNEENKN